MKKIYMISCLFLILVSLTGCGDKKEVDYDVSEQTVITEEEADIPSEMVAEFYGENYRLKIDAEIKLPEEYENCAVLSVTPDYFEEADIEELSNKIFDEGSYFLYMPYNMEQISFLQGKLADLKVNEQDGDTLYAFESMEIGLEADLMGYENGEEEIEIDGYKYYNRFDMNFCTVIGTIDGEWYRLNFDNSYGGSNIRLEQITNGNVDCYLGVMQDSLEVKLNGNRCTYTVEEAQSLAEDYIADFGYTEGYKVTEVVNVLNNKFDPETYEQTEVVDGYFISFGRAYGNYSVVNSRASNLLQGYGNVLPFSQETINVLVTSEGVVGFEVVNPHVMDSVLSESTRILSFDKIEAIIDEEIGVSSEKTSSVHYDVNEIRLGYRMITYEDGNKAVIPAWHFMHINEDGSLYSNQILLVVNAIDGTIVWNEMYGY